MSKRPVLTMTTGQPMSKDELARAVERFRYVLVTPRPGEEWRLWFGQKLSTVYRILSVDAGGACTSEVVAEYGGKPSPENIGRIQTRMFVGYYHSPGYFERVTPPVTDDDAAEVRYEGVTP